MTLLQTVTFFSFVFIFLPQANICAKQKIRSRQETPSQAAAQQTNADLLLVASANGKDQTVAYLLLDGVNPNCEDSNGDSALMLAALGGHVTTAEWLLRAGAKPEHKNKAHFTAADLAVQNGHLLFIKLFIDNNLIDKDQRNAYGFTLLMIAAQYAHDDIIQALATANADLNRESLFGHTAVALAMARGHGQTVRLLHSLGAHFPSRAVALDYLQEKSPAMHLVLQELCK